MKSTLKFVVLVTLAHLVTYLFAGVIAQVVLGAREFYPPAAHAISYLRDPLSAYVQTWLWPAQVARGILFALVMLPFRPRIASLGQLRGGLALTSLVLLLGYVAASGGLIEHLVYFNEYPPKFGLITLVEIALQAALLGQWIAWRELKAARRGEKTAAPPHAAPEAVRLQA